MKYILIALFFLYGCNADESPTPARESDAGLDLSIEDLSVDSTFQKDAISDLGEDLGNESQSITFDNGGSIFINEDSLQLIAKDLSTLIKESTMLDLKVVKARPNGGKFISLKLGCQVSKDGFIRSSPSENEIEFCAQEPIGIQYAVNDFAERSLGKRWLFPNNTNLGTYTPKKDRFEIDRKKKIDAPAYKNRRFSIGKIHDSYRDWGKRHRLYSSKAAFHHNLYNLFPPEKYYQSNPEFYPLYKGLRYPRPEFVGACKNDSSKCTDENHRWQPVLRAQGLLEEGVKNITSIFDTSPNLKWYSLGMNDSIVWGDQQMQGHPTNSLGYINMSDDYFPWATELVSEITKTHPGRKFGLLAYHNLADPPTEKVHENIIPFMTFDRMQWVDPDRKSGDQLRTKKWEERASELGWYDYVYGDQTFSGDVRPIYSVPRVYPHLMGEYLRFGRDHNVKHYYAEAYPAESWSEGPKLYLLSKLLWNPDLDVDEVLSDWYRSAVGPGASALQDYYSFWENFWTERVPKSKWFKSSKGDYLYFGSDNYLISLELKDRDYLEGRIDEMIKKTRGGEFEKRADFFYQSWNEVKARAFGPRFDFENGNTPDGYTKVFTDSLETSDTGVLPTDWHYWNRSSAMSTINAASLSTSFKKEGQKSFHMSTTPDGIHEAFSLLYRSLPVNPKTTRFCIRAEILSPKTTYEVSFSFYRKGESKQRYQYSRSYPPTLDGWNTSALCTQIPADDSQIEKMTIWFGVKGKEAKTLESWFDFIEVFTAP